MFVIKSLEEFLTEVISILVHKNLGEPSLYILYNLFDKQVRSLLKLLLQVLGSFFGENLGQELTLSEFSRFLLRRLALLGVSF